MAAINIGDIAEFRLEYVANGQTCFNVLHYEVVITNLALDNQAVMTDILAIESSLVAGTLVQAFRGVFSDGVDVIALHGQWVFPTRWRGLRDAVGSPGTVAGECNAQNLQVTIQKSGALANRHNLGAVRVGGVPATFFDDGMVVPPGVAAYDDLMSTLAEPIANTPADVVLSPVILNKVNVGTPEEPEYEISGGTPVLVWTRKGEVRTQRTRTVGRGI